MRRDPDHLPAVHPSHSSPAPPFASFHAQADSNMKPETLERKSIPIEHPPLLNVTKEVDRDPSTPFLEFTHIVQTRVKFYGQISEHVVQVWLVKHAHAQCSGRE